METVIFLFLFAELESRPLCGRNCIPFFFQFKVLIHGCGGFHLVPIFAVLHHLSSVSIQDCVKIRTIFLERAVVAKKKAEYIIYRVSHSKVNKVILLW